MSTDDMVKFLMPGGVEVSNDPRFDLDEALTESLNSRPTTGSVGPTWDEQNAQIIAEKMAALNSGQPGVGENATVDDPTKELHGPLGSPAQRIQKEDLLDARMAGASPKSTSVEDDEPIDSNERVLEVRKAQDKAREAYAKAMEKLGDEEPGEGTNYAEWSGKQLKAEVAKRNADEGRSEENQLKIVSGMKVPDVAAMLTADDERISNEAGTEDNGENSGNPGE